MAKELFVSKSNDLPDGERKIVPNGNYEIGVYRVNGDLFAYQNVCPHQGGPACEGLLMAKVEEVIAEEKTYHPLSGQAGGCAAALAVRHVRRAPAGGFRMRPRGPAAPGRLGRQRHHCATGVAEALSPPQEQHRAGCDGAGAARHTRDARLCST